MPATERLSLQAHTALAPSANQAQTRDAFGYKWSRRSEYESTPMQESSRTWLFERYCKGDPALLSHWLAEGGTRKLILDAGCGSGYSALLFFGDHLKDHDYLGVDISEACEIARSRFAEHGQPGEFLQCSLLDLEIPNGSIDLIFSEGVLHHTDSTRASLEFLAKKLAPGGRFLFYVYAKKAVVREFTDDHIRKHLQNLSDQDAWEALMPLTHLGITLGQIDATIDVPEDIPFLGIRRGPMNLQRFFYWNIFKAFYHPEFTVQEMNHVNFDWFRPLNCHRHTPEEVSTWVKDAGLDIETMNVQESGITMVARRSS